MALQFIDQKGAPGADIGSAERRLIRSHVMKGKNAGRPRRSTKRQAALLYPIRRVLTWSGPSVVVAPAARPRQLLWSDLSLTSFPQQLDSESTKLMHRWFFDISDELFPPQFCCKFDIIKSIWVNCILQDEAYFHSTLAISASYVEFCQRKPSVSPKTLHHIAKAYELVNVKLSGPDSISDSAIAAVVALVMYQQVHNQHSAGLVHLHGLFQMIQLRGGIFRLLRENRALALKALRVDAELALQNGSATIFGGDDLRNAVLPDSEAFKAIRENLPNAAPAESPYFMLEVVAFSKVLDTIDQKGSSRLDPLGFMEIMIWLLYHLIEASQLGQLRSSVSEGQYEAVANLGMLAFMTTLLPEYGRVPDRSNYPLLCRRLKSAIQDLHFTSTLEENRESWLLLLWALFMGGHLGSLELCGYSELNRA
ncbi:hypothetical protein INS49_012406 [Diaporthe citri]|uniref:uncharacterized protein n=1 Tax=Diaporthe citri TaxID=83186 RepID=UPI001C7E42D5|nr:uncharacterized protein INS49_012406 [Diaporthe citri]KAG6358887.1 hypothetical protein INS49_012406 [Diaporthe citri]